MKRFFATVVFFAAAMGLLAQTGPVPVQISIKPISHRRGSGGEFYSNTQASRALQITIRNITSKPVSGLIVRWAIVKTRTGSYSSSSSTRNYRERAFGAEETIDLKPMEQRLIETEAVESAHEDDNYSGTIYGEKIIGHGVQILIGDKVILEEFVPPTPSMKKAFEKIYPLEKEEDPGPAPINSKKKAKKDPTEK